MDLKEQKELTRKNLERVLNELPLLAEKMPEIEKDFDMGNFGIYDKLKKINLNECGTAGCLLGNAARIFEDEFTDDLFGEVNQQFYYNLFGRKFFPYLYDRYFNGGNIMWGYLFCGFWAKTKFKDLDSALQRIKNLLDNDLECKAFDYTTNKIIN